MRKRKVLGLLAVGLVAGLTLGSLGIAIAGTSSTATTQTPMAPPGGPGGRGFGHGPGGGLASAVASLTGTTVQDVMTKRQAGTSFAEIAKAKGVTAAQVVEKALAPATAELKTHLTAEVSATGQVGPPPGAPSAGATGTVAPAELPPAF